MQEAKSSACFAKSSYSNKHLAEIHHKITFFVAKMIYELFYIMNTNDCQACRYFEIKTQRNIEILFHFFYVIVGFYGFLVSSNFHKILTS